MLTDPPPTVEGTDGTPAAHQRFQHVFRAEPVSVRKALRRAVARFARGISADDAGTLELTLAEVLNNVVEHSYANLPPGLVEMHLEQESEALACRIEDFGRSMPGWSLPDRGLPPLNVDIADLAEGGWGWSLIRELTTDLGYERRNNRNILTFRVPVHGNLTGR